jgi:hypothetical protein
MRTRRMMLLRSRRVLLPLLPRRWLLSLLPGLIGCSRLLLILLLPRLLTLFWS